MKIANVVRTLAAGAAIYVVMAACAATEHLDQSAVDGGGKGGASASGGGGGGSEDGPSSSSGAFVDAFADALTSPVAEASAEPLAPESVTENCDKIREPFRYAEHSYPGMTAAEITVNVVPLVASTNGPAGYTLAPSVLSWVKDGAGAVICGSSSSAAGTVTFVRRR